jgi:hypothetical protein
LAASFLRSTAAAALPNVADSVEKVENTAKTKFSAQGE